jgi:outer membrane immunogenic protein
MRESLVRPIVASILMWSSFDLANAADMPVKAPPPAKPVIAAWTGFYAGVNVGYGYGDDPASELVISGAGFPVLGSGTTLYGSPNAFNARPQGVIGGGQIGYNFQVAPTWIAGLEADLQGSGMKDSRSCVFTCGALFTSANVFPVFFFPSAFSAYSSRAKSNGSGLYVVASDTKTARICGT